MKGATCGAGKNMQNAKVLIVAVLAGLVGCASQGKTASTTTMTAADVQSTKSSFEAAPSSREASSSSSAKAEELPGQLVCKTSNRIDGTTELRLEWNGDSAHGTIRTIAPSGETTVEHIKAERHRGMIIVDEPGQEDLVKHAAVVAPSNGKQAMRVGSGMYATCE
jgi:hypothetical protein